MDLVAKEGLGPDQMAIVLKAIGTINHSMEQSNKAKLDAARKATVEACKAVVAEALDAFYEV